MTDKEKARDACEWLEEHVVNSGVGIVCEMSAKAFIEKTPKPKAKPLPTKKKETGK